MKYEYTKKIIELIENVEVNNETSLKEAVELFKDTIRNDKLIHTFGTGHAHMVGVELFARAGGLANIDVMLDPDCLPEFGAQRSCAMEKVEGIADHIYDNYKFEEGDIIVITSNSGRNAIPIEMALRCKKEGIKIIAVTNLKHSMSQSSRHSSGKKLYEIADVVVDTGVPVGDVTLDFKGHKTGPASSIVCMYIVDLIAAIASEELINEGVKVRLFESQNVDGFNNDEIYEHYDGRIKHY